MTLIKEKKRQESKMKIFLIFLFFSSGVYGKTLTLRRIDALEKKVEQLQQRVAKLEQKRASSTDENSGLNVKDLKGQQQTSYRETSSVSDISPAQKEQIMKTIQNLKNSQKKSQETLEKIMNEDY
jgi:polyhydroxyalkanoate synthesis regulator phasin|tara:strand:- start:244 stop:618 length:375 start_codon:yes stop_codon:yes gene_type:complete